MNCLTNHIKNKILDKKKLYGHKTAELSKKIIHAYIHTEYRSCETFAASHRNTAHQYLTHSMCIKTGRQSSVAPLLVSAVAVLLVYYILYPPETHQVLREIIFSISFYL